MSKYNTVITSKYLSYLTLLIIFIMLSCATCNAGTLTVRVVDTSLELARNQVNHFTKLLKDVSAIDRKDMWNDERCQTLVKFVKQQPDWSNPGNKDKAEPIWFACNEDPECRQADPEDATEPCWGEM